MDIVDEKNSSQQPVSFYDEAKALILPTSATYRIDDLDSGVVIKASTVISPLASSVDIDITSAENAMQDPTKAYEIRLITLEWSYGANKEGKSERRYQVKNLTKIS